MKKPIILSSVLCNLVISVPSVEKEDERLELHKILSEFSKSLYSMFISYKKEENWSASTVYNEAYRVYQDIVLDFFGDGSNSCEYDKLEKMVLSKLDGKNKDQTSCPKSNFSKQYILNGEGFSVKGKMNYIYEQFDWRTYCMDTLFSFFCDSLIKRFIERSKDQASILHDRDVLLGKVREDLKLYANVLHPDYDIKADPLNYFMKSENPEARV